MYSKVMARTGSIEWLFWNFFQNSQENTCDRDFLLVKFQTPQARCSTVNFVKYLGAVLLLNTSGQLALYILITLLKNYVRYKLVNFKQLFLNSNFAGNFWENSTAINYKGLWYSHFNDIPMKFRDRVF